MVREGISTQGGEIIKYTPEMIRTFAAALANSYRARQTVALPFREWQKDAFPLMVNNPGANSVKMPKEGELIRVAPSTQRMLEICDEHKKDFEYIQLHVPNEKKDFEISKLAREIIKPELEFEYHPFYFEADGLKLPIWFDTTVKGVNVRYGFENGDTSTPACLSLNDDSVHTMLGGATGQGKSVALHTVILNLLLEYPPWELMLYLADFKITELSKYADRIPTPHAKMIAATGSTEFVMSFYEEIVSEMNRRQVLFNKLGVEKLSNLRSKLGMAIPRGFLIVDEFVQQKTNIQKSEAMGNENSSEELKAMQTKIGELARLGRSMGMHMLFSSQSLEGALDSQTEQQFSSGAALKATKAVSTSLIGNDASAYIKGKGKIYVNPNKSAKDSRDNIFVRVPLIKTDQSEEERARGDLTEQLKILQELNRNADLVGYHSEPYYYNENTVIPFELFTKAKEYAYSYYKDAIPAKDDVDREIFRQDTAFCIAIGRPIKYNTTPSEILTLQRIKRNNCILGAIDRKDLDYMVMLLKQGCCMYDHEAIIVAASKSIYLGTHLNDYKSNSCSVKVTVIERAAVPDVLMDKFRSRRLLLDVQGHIIDSTGKLWDTKACVQYFVNSLQNQRYPIKASPDKLRDWADRHIQNELLNSMQDEFQSADKDNVEVIAGVIRQTATVYNTLKAVTGLGHKLVAKDLPPIVVWWAGLDEIESIQSDGRRAFSDYLDKSCQANIYNFIMASVWSKVGQFSENCDYILERCKKDFFVDLGIPKQINTNANSIQLIQRSLKKSVILSMYTL